MNADASGPAEPVRAAELPPRWAYDGRGAVVYDRDLGLPDGSLREAQRITVHSSLIGILAGVLIVVVADIFGLTGGGIGIFAAAFNSVLMPVRRGYLLRVGLAYVITVVVLVVPCVVLVGSRLPEPWQSFVALALALLVGKQVAAAAAYLRFRGDASRS